MSADLSQLHSAALRAVVTAIDFHLKNRVCGSPGLAAGGTATNFKFTYAFSYIIGGLVCYKAATDNIAAPGYSTSSGEYRKVGVFIDSSGTVTTAAGAVAASQALAELPATPDDTILVGSIELTPSFTSGSTSVTNGMCKNVTYDLDYLAT